MFQLLDNLSVTNDRVVKATVLEGSDRHGDILRILGLRFMCKMDLEGREILEAKETDIEEATGVDIEYS